MKFLKIFLAVLVCCFVFMFFGGFMLFNFRESFCLATASCAFVIAVVAYIFLAQEEKIEQLEKRVEALEKKA